MTRRSIALTDELYAYLVDVSVRESDVLRRLREVTAPLEDASMQIGPEQGQFMQMLVGLIGARTVLELGTFTGYSALCLASGLPADGRVVTCDIDAEWPEFAERYWEEAGVAHKIERRTGDANDLLDQMIADGMSGSFDFAFIDADKTGLSDYYEKCLTLVRVGGLVTVDNTLWSGKVADPTVTDSGTEAIRAFNAQAFDDPRVDLSLLPLGDGLERYTENIHQPGESASDKADNYDKSKILADHCLRRG